MINNKEKEAYKLMGELLNYKICPYKDESDYSFFGVLL